MQPVARYPLRIKAHSFENRPPMALYLLRLCESALAQRKALRLLRMRQMSVDLDRNMGRERIFQEPAGECDEIMHRRNVAEAQNFARIDAVMKSSWLGRRGKIDIQ